MNEEIVKTIREKGLMLEKEIFDLVSNFKDTEMARDFLNEIVRYSGQKIITRSVLSKNFEYVQKLISNIPEKEMIDDVFIRLGINLEVTKEIIKKEFKKEFKQEFKQDYQVFYADTKPNKKIEVNDFVCHFRARYQQLQKILMHRTELQNLVSINKISGNRQSFSIIGIVSEKRTTKNGNIIVKFEDLTGEISGVIKSDREEVFSKAKELQLDDIVGIKAAGNRDILFIHDIIYPDAFISEKVRFDNETCVAFLSDLHAGSDRHLKKSMEKFLVWVNSEHEIAKKIKYIFFVGDNVDGVGVFPGQENFLNLKSMKEQYELVSSYLKRIPKHITMFMCPGQHDAMRVAEPQPPIDRRYASSLYEIENLVLVTNPTLVKLNEGNKEFKVLMYHGASIHTFINEIEELREMKAHNCPAKAVKHMLKRRHLSPTHSSVVYIPYVDKDPLVISEVPDVLCTGEVHKLDIENYNGVLIITGSCWQAKTAFEEKVGNEPDPCKVPILNLKTRELKVFDFGVEEEINRDFNKKETEK
ncbi:MAG: metallophosphoesterase [archaeon]|nr:metallophosphoesterase [archaeon]